MAARKKNEKQKRDPSINERLKERSLRATKQNDVKIWETRLELSLQEMANYLEEYNRNLLFYVGEQDIDQTELVRRRQFSIVVNRIMPSIASQIAAIIPRMPWFRMEANQPLDAEAIGKLQALEFATNFLIQRPRMAFMQNVRVSYIAAMLAFPVLKVSHTPDEGEDPQEGKRLEYGQLVLNDDPETGLQTMDIEGGTPLLDEDGNLQVRRGNKVLLDTRAPEEYFHLDWVDWRDIRLDPEGGNNPFQHSWIAQRVSWKLKDFQVNAMFDSDIRRSAAEYSQSLLTDVYRDRRKSRGSGDFTVRGRDMRQAGYLDSMRVFGYQIWDFENRQVLYHVDGAHKMAAKHRIPGWIDDIYSPYSLGKFHEVPGEFNPYPEITPARPLARSYNLTRSQKINHVRRFNRKYVAKKGSLGALGTEFLKDPEDGMIAELNDPNLIRALEDAPLDPTIYNDQDRDIYDMSEIVGSAPEARGSSQSGSATQAAIVDRRGTSREGLKRAIFGEFLENAVNGLKSCLQANLDRSLSFRIVGPMGATWEGPVERADIDVQATARLSMTEMEPYDASQAKQDMVLMMTAIGPELALKSPAFSKEFFDLMMPHNKEVASELTQIVSAAAQQPQQPTTGPDQKNGSPGGGSQPPTGKTQGAPKPTGQGPEKGNTTEGRAAGRKLTSMGGTVSANQIPGA